MSNHITTSETLSISTMYRNMTVSKVDGNVIISIIYPGDQRESSQTLTIDGLDKSDLQAIHDFLGKLISSKGA